MFIARDSLDAGTPLGAERNKHRRARCATPRADYGPKPYRRSRFWNRASFLMSS